MNYFFAGIWSALWFIFGPIAALVGIYAVVTDNPDLMLKAITLLAISIFLHVFITWSNLKELQARSLLLRKR